VAGGEPGVEAAHTSELGLLSASDGAIFAAARAAGAAVVTKDVDFVEPLERRGPPPQVVWVTAGNVSNAGLPALVAAAYSPSAWPSSALASRWWSWRPSSAAGICLRAICPRAI
jgi:hypothetical protein